MRNFTLPLKQKINRALASFSGKERLLFGVLVVVMALSALSLLEMLNRSLMTRVPLRGGSLAEGILGSPRFVNPVLGTSAADLDMIALIYSGLMRTDPAGTLVPDLAASYEASADGLTYTFVLKDDVSFHDGSPVTADDVVFTVNQVKNSLIKSPEKANWDGITAEKVDDRTVVFTLREPRADFLENATLGIMPRALWEHSSIELNEANTAPVGSGPYRIESVVRENSGVIDAYTLAAFDNFAAGEPFIQKISLHFYQNEDALVRALEDGEIDQAGSVSPAVAVDLAKKGYVIDSVPLPRVFGLFFNQNQNQLFIDSAVRSAIIRAIDTEGIVREVLLGYGVPIDGPIPASFAGGASAARDTASRDDVLARVRQDLDRAGWALGTDGFRSKTVVDKNKKKVVTPLAFAVSTGNAPELVRTAELIQADLAAVGIKADIKTFEVGNLNQSVIRPRKYDALLFGQVVSRPADLYAFWHSSQRKDPGQNVALYTNAKADDLLEGAFAAASDAERAKKYAQFETEVQKDMPAAFLYSPDFIYVVSPRVKGIALDRIVAPADRFAAVSRWFIDTENVWKIFSN